MAYSANTKVKFDQLDQDLQDRLNAILDKESDNQNISNENKTKLNTLFTEINTKINSLESLADSITTRVTEEISYLNNYNTHIYGYGEGLDYANNNALKGQLCKNDYHENKRVIPWNGITLVRLCNISNQESILNQPVPNNEKYAYNYENHRVYFYTSHNSWVLYEPVDEGKYIFLYHNLIFDTVSKKLWYFINPHKAIYLWTYNDFKSNMRDSIHTPRVQEPIEYQPTDSVTDPEKDIIQYEAKFKNTIHITARDAKRPDQKYEYNILVGNGNYFKDYNIIRNNPYEYKFNSYCDGPAKVQVLMEWNMYKKPYPEEVTLTKILNDKDTWNFKSKGKLEVYLDDNKQMTFSLNRDFLKWNRVFNLLPSNLTKGEHILKVNIESDIYNHLFINHLEILVTHI